MFLEVLFAQGHTGTRQDTDGCRGIHRYMQRDTQGSPGMHRDTEGHREIQRDTEGYRGIDRYAGIHRDTDGYTGIQRDEEYKGTCRDTEGYAEIRMDTEAPKGHRSQKCDRGVQNEAFRRHRRGIDGNEHSCVWERLVWTLRGCCV